MRNLVIATFLIFNSLSASAAEPLTNAQYASIIADVFALLKKPEDFKKFVLHNTRPKDRKLFEAEMAGIQFIPAVKANGASLKFDFHGEIETMTVIDGAKNLFQINGVEIDLDPTRPLQDRLQQIERLSSRTTANLWNIAFPAANAKSKVAKRFAIAGAGVVAGGATQFHNYVDAGMAATRLNWICGALKAEPNSKLRSIFSSKASSMDSSIEDRIDQDEKYATHKLERGTNWQPSVRETLARSKSRYCNYDKGFAWLWHEARKLNAYNFTSEQKEDTCQEIRSALTCYSELAQKREMPIYKIQHEQIVKWLKTIDPGLSETKVAEDFRVEQPVQTATKPNSRNVVKEKGAAR